MTLIYIENDEEYLSEADTEFNENDYLSEANTEFNEND